MGRSEKHLWPHDDQSKCDRIGIEKEKEGTNRTWICTLWRDGERLKDGLSSLGFRRWMDRRLNRIKRNRLRRKRSGFVEIACVPWKRRSNKVRGKREEETVGFIHHHPPRLSPPSAATSTKEFASGPGWISSMVAASSSS